MLALSVRAAFFDEFAPVFVENSLSFSCPVRYHESVLTTQLSPPLQVAFSSRPLIYEGDCATLSENDMLNFQDLSSSHRPTSRTVCAALSACGFAVAASMLAGCSFLGSGNDTSAFDLKVGQCIEAPPEDEIVESLPVVECSEPHVGEVMYDYEIDAPEYSESLSDEATVECAKHFEEYVGVPLEASQLDVAPLSPSEDSWKEGDRVVSCLIFHETGQTLNQSVRDSKM